MVDRYQEDVRRITGMHTELSQLFAERQQAAEEKKTTAKFDYQLKRKLDALKPEIVAMEKLLYLYENNDKQYASLNSVEKSKRIKTLKASLKEWKATNSDVSSAVGHKEKNGSINEASPSMDYKPVKLNDERDKDGELQNTRGLDNQMLLQQQKNMLQN